MIFKKPEPEPETVACSTCGHIVLQSSASYVLVTDSNRKYWYCSDHHKPYDECCPWLSSVSCYPHDRYYRRMCVDKSGTPIGYMKIPDTEPTK